MAKQPIKIDLPSRMDFGKIDESAGSTLTISMRYRCESALDALKKGDIPAARKFLHAAKDLDPNFADIWFFLAGLAETYDEQMKYLETVLGFEPANHTVINILAQLKAGKATPPPTDTARPRQLEEGEADYKSLVCPECGGRLQYHVGDRNVRCNFCHYLVLDADGMMRQEGKQTALVVGLLERKNRPKDWHIGERWLKCNNCGAVITVTRQTLTNSCRFCDSRQIVVQKIGDYHLEQPDIIIPFGVDEEQARAQIDKKLKSGVRMLTRLWADPIKHIRLNALYLPFWLFDGDSTVHINWGGGLKDMYPVLFANVPYFAATTVSHFMLDEIEPYRFEEAIDYDARLLATHPAELYSMDVDQASLDVRTKISRLAIREAKISTSVSSPAQYSWDGEREERNLSASYHATTNHMSYRLGLLPVWVGLLEEVDGDTRQVLVNGQTGEVALGKLVKAKE